MPRQRITRSLLVAVLLALMPLLVTGAQEIPATPDPGSAPTGR